MVEQVAARRRIGRPGRRRRRAARRRPPIMHRTHSNFGPETFASLAACCLLLAAGGSYCGTRIRMHRCTDAQHGRSTHGLQLYGLYAGRSRLLAWPIVEQSLSTFCHFVHHAAIGRSCTQAWPPSIIILGTIVFRALGNPNSPSHAATVLPTTTY